MSRRKTYKVVAVSVYHADIEQLAAKVAEARRRGHHGMSKSRLVRIALRRLDVAALTPSEAL